MVLMVQSDFSLVFIKPDDDWSLFKQWHKQTNKQTNKQRLVNRKCEQLLWCHEHWWSSTESSIILISVDRSHRLTNILLHHLWRSNTHWRVWLNLLTRLFLSHVSASLEMFSIGVIGQNSRKTRGSTSSVFTFTLSRWQLQRRKKKFVHTSETLRTVGVLRWFVAAKLWVGNQQHQEENTEK